MEAQVGGQTCRKSNSKWWALEAEHTLIPPTQEMTKVKRTLFYGSRLFHRFKILIL